jgi:uncharacterized metal-binding protein YceD (DUF177 family)
MTTILDPVWSDKIDVQHIKGQKERFALKPDAALCQTIADFIGIEALSDLEAVLYIHKMPKRYLYKVTGNIKATLTQQCVVSLEPVKTTITDDSLEGWYSNDTNVIALEKAKRLKIAETQKDAEFPIMNDEDDPDIIEDNMIDLGALALEYLVMNIPLFPRADQAKIAPEYVEDEKKNPFAVLQGLLPKDRG